MKNPLVPIAIAATLTACAERPVTEATVPPPAIVASANAFVRSSLVSDIAGFGEKTIDKNLLVPWGLAFGRTGVLWVANNRSGTATLYGADGSARSRVVTIPGGSPTGIAPTSGAGFEISGGPASWVFAGEYGIISAWNSSSDDARIVVDRSSLGAVYKGIAIASVGNASRIYATNFKSSRIEMYDASFNLTGEFTDPDLPAGYAPFGIQNIDGQLFVTFAKHLTEADDDPGAGNGFVDIFTPDGVLVRRFASNGPLNSPWGIAVAPQGFGSFSNHVLIGNFGDGRISVYDQAGRFVDQLRGEDGAPVSIGGLWGLTFGVGGAASSLYFVGCPNPDSKGLVGTFTVK